MTATVEDTPAAQDAPATPAPSPEQVARDQANVARRRAGRLPYALAATTGAVGTIAWGASAAAVDLGVPAAVTSMAAGAGVAGVAALVGRIKRGAITEQWRSYYWRVCSTMAGLVSLESFCGASWGGSGALSALGVTFVAEELLAARWRQAHEESVEPYTVPELDPFEGLRLLFNPKYVCRAERERRAAEEAAIKVRQTAAVALMDAAKIEAFDPVIGELQRRWACHVSPSGGVLPGAKLTNPKRLDDTRIRFIIEITPGSCVYEDVAAQKVRLAAALLVLRDRVSFAKHPESESKIVLTVAVAVVEGEIGEVSYKGPRYDNGRVPLGPTRDGNYSFVDLKTDGGACHVLMTGAHRVGKTSAIEMIAMAALHSGEWTWMWCDGDPEGGSSPLLNRIAHVAGAGPRAALMQLEAVEAELKRRSIEKKTITIDKATGLPVPITDPATQVPADKVVPCRQYPGLMWNLDEWKRFVDDPLLQESGFVGRVEHVARVGPKYGVGVFVSTHSNLRFDFDGNTALRGLLATNNYLAFRNTNRREADTINGVEVHPADLPEGGGYHYSTRSGGTTMARTERPSDDDRQRWAVMIMQVRARVNPDTELVLAPLRELTAADPVKAMESAMAAMERWRQERQRGEEQSTPESTPAIAETGDIDAQLAGWPGAADLLRETLGRGLTLIKGGAEDDGDSPVLKIHELKMLAALPGKNAHIARVSGYTTSYVEKTMPQLVAAGFAAQEKPHQPYLRTERGDRAVREAAGELDAEAEREIASDTDELIEQAN